MRAEVAANCPIPWNALHNAWVLGRHSHVTQALRDPRFSAARLLDGLTAAESARKGGMSTFHRLLTASLHYTDPPAHTGLRKRVRSVLSRRVVQQMRSSFQASVNEVVMDKRNAPATSASERLAEACSSHLAAQLLGIPPADIPMVLQWCQTVATFASTQLTLLCLDLVGPRAPDDINDAVLALQEYFCTHRVGRHAATSNGPGQIFDGLVGVANTYSAEEVAALKIQLLVGSLETMPHFMRTSLPLLQDHRSQLVSEQPNRAWIRRIVEELLRFGTAGKPQLRIAVHDVDLGECSIRAGDRVVLSLTEANRDPERFFRPDEFDPHQDSSQHIAFGAGPHYCLGATIVRMQAEETVRSVLAGP
jgi:pimeloyl-[acyl-carrier protein] synthase